MVSLEGPWMFSPWSSFTFTAESASSRGATLTEEVSDIVPKNRVYETPATEATVRREVDLDGGDSFDMVRLHLAPAFARASHPASRPPFLPFSRFSTSMRWPEPLRGPP